MHHLSTILRRRCVDQGAPPSAIFGQNLEDKLSQNVASSDSDKARTLEQILEIAQRFQIPMGIEWVDRQNEAAAKPKHLRNASVRQLLSSVLI